jgi:hypothetical protein
MRRASRVCWPYAWAFDYYREHGVPIRVARIFNTYGPRMALDDGRVVSNFVKQALEGVPMTVYGDGSQVGTSEYRCVAFQWTIVSEQSHIMNPRLLF